jgi:urate oxidase
VHDSYGKSRVRLTKVTRNQNRHDLKEIEVAISLEGSFADSFISGENASLVATDSIKNTVYILAKNHAIDTIESFAVSVARHFVDTYAHVRSASVEIAEELWRRIEVDGKTHDHAFFGANQEKHVARAKAVKDSVEVESGIQGLRMVKTTASEFWGFIRDRYTTLPDLKERIFGTSVIANWQYSSASPDYQKTYEKVRGLVLETFATHHSLSVQQTIYEIAQNALAQVDHLKEITITMPNQHRVLFDLKPFELENDNEIFVTTDEPHGLVSATVRRER